MRYFIKSGSIVPCNLFALRHVSANRAGAVWAGGFGGGRGGGGGGMLHV